MSAQAQKYISPGSKIVSLTNVDRSLFFSLPSFYFPPGGGATTRNRRSAPGTTKTTAAAPLPCSSSCPTYASTSPAPCWSSSTPGSFAGPWTWTRRCPTTSARRPSPTGSRGWRRCARRRFPSAPTVVPAGRASVRGGSGARYCDGGGARVVGWLGGW